MEVNRDIRVMQITSPDAAAGKSTVLANLAVAIAHTGKRVMVVDCDLRRPSIHEFFGLGNATGFTSVLLNDVTLASALRPVDGEPNIAVLPAGPASPNPSELLSSPAAAGIIQQLRLGSICDVILVDCPPILPVADAVIISAYVDATVVVAAAGETTQSRLREAIELIRQVDAPLIGLVLNGVQAHEGYGSYGYEPAETGVSSPTKLGRLWVSPEAKRRMRAASPTPTTPREPRRRKDW